VLGDARRPVGLELGLAEALEHLEDRRPGEAGPGERAAHCTASVHVHRRGAVLVRRLGVLGRRGQVVRRRPHVEAVAQFAVRDGVDLVEQVRDLPVLACVGSRPAAQRLHPHRHRGVPVGGVGAGPLHLADQGGQVSQGFRDRLDITRQG
jgi:hypothetical protein